MKTSTLRILVVILSALLIFTLILASRLPGDEPAPTQGSSSSLATPPTSQVPASSSIPASSAPASSAPTVPPTTQPATQPGVEYVGSLYTREFLESLPSKSTGYGVGKSVDSKNRPTYAISLEKQILKLWAKYLFRFLLNLQVTPHLLAI